MSAEKGKLYAFWLDFFRNAGILPTFDTKYALVFEDNRIKPDMLLDLTKECLRDMEITAMGDIIAILRHAKAAHEKSKTLAFGNSNEEANNETAGTTVASSTSVPLAPASSSKPVPAKLEKVTTTTPSLATTSKVSVNVKAPNKTVKDSTKLALQTESTKTDPEQGNAGTVPAKQEAEKQTGKAQKRFIIVDPESSSDSDLPDPVKRPREASPAEQKKRSSTASEGFSGLLSSRLGPSVSTEKVKPSTTKGVFDRLGRTSDGNPCISGEATIIRPNPSSTISKSTMASGSDSSSVFERLGQRGSASVSTSTRTTADEPSSSRSRPQDDFDRRRDSLRREDSRDSSRGSYEGSDRRITLRQRSPQLASPVVRVARNPPEYRSPSSTVSRLHSDVSDYKTPSPRGRSDSDLRSRVGSGTGRERESRRKIIGTTIIKTKNRGRDFRVGQVLKSTRIERSDGTSVVQRFIVKKVSKPPPTRRGYLRSRSPSESD